MLTALHFGNLVTFDALFPAVNQTIQSIIFITSDVDYLVTIDFNFLRQVTFAIVNIFILCCSIILLFNDSVKNIVYKLDRIAITVVI
ncbi:hypothetical protein CBW42_09020 [Butyricicoccus porcorum]|uniref:Uncharacterized protein n=1 Tax=Butyricicoccus porcorum TaxID=1945634 RepID=A0A252F369_9FIRM|nr:hypothetical protein CBW42_09020 [Butyricicoccus porcorum]